MTWGRDGRGDIIPVVSPLSPWPDNQPPLLASPTIGAVYSADAEQILGDLIAAHRLGTTPSGDFAASFRSANVGPMQVIFQRYRGFESIDLVDPIPYVAMTIPLSGDLLVSVDGREYRVPVATPLVFNPGAKPRMMGPATADFLTLTVPLDVVQDHLSTYLPGVDRGTAVAFGTVGSRKAAGALAQAMRHVQQALDAGVAHTPEQQAHLGEILVSSLLLTHPHSHLRELYTSGPDASDSAVWEAVAVLRESPHERITIAELARDTGVSIRSLQVGFRRLLGTTPSLFQRDLRLERAFQLISSYDPRKQPSVAELSTLIGYANAGRFAADFFDRFGMHPSVALRERRRAVRPTAPPTR